MTSVCYNTPGVYNPPNAHYSQVAVPASTDIGLLIGKDGRHFKFITHRCGSTYIWYDKARDVIEVWGPEVSIPKTVGMLKSRMAELLANDP